MREQFQRNVSVLHCIGSYFQMFDRCLYKCSFFRTSAASAYCNNMACLKQWCGAPRERMSFVYGHTASYNRNLRRAVRNSLYPNRDCNLARGRKPEYLYPSLDFNWLTTPSNGRQQLLFWDGLRRVSLCANQQHFPSMQLLRRDDLDVSKRLPG